MAFVYFAAAALTVQFTRFEGGVAFVWIASAILLAKLLTTPRRRWLPLCLVCVPASFFVTGLFGLGWEVAFPLALVNVAEALVTAWALKRLSPGFGRFRSIRETLLFILVTGLIAPAFSGLFGAWAAYSVTGVPYWSNWLSWSAGHGLGFITIAPTLLMIYKGQATTAMRNANHKERFEGALALAAVLWPR